MSTAGHNIANPDNLHPTAPGEGAGHGFPADQIKGTGGRAEVQVSASVADRFEAAKNTAHERSATLSPTANVDDDKHKAGFENISDRARNMTAVTNAKVQSGDTAETRHPDVGFPARPHVH